VLDLPKAYAIIDAFGLLVDEVTAPEDLDGLGLYGMTANAAVRLSGTDAGPRFREDPYLLTLLEPWPEVDAAALASGLLPDDPRHLLAAVDVAAARAFRRTTENNLGGHTVVLRRPLRARVQQMLEGRPAVDTFEQRAPATKYETTAGNITPAQLTVAPLHAIYAGMSRTTSVNLSELIS
jgi:hypothetical protein